MNILFYRYGSICEPDLLEVFRNSGLHVIEETTEIRSKSIPPSERIRILAEKLLAQPVQFVFSINFFPHVSDVCERFHIPYLCWSVDCPVLELFSSSIRNTCNRIFLFDYAQYQRFHPQNPDRIFYLPLATNTDRWDSVIHTMTPEEKADYSADISFVGSLYTEKSPLSALTLTSYMQGLLAGITQAQSQIYGYNFLEEMVTDDIVDALKKADPSYLSIPSPFEDTDHYVAANYYLGMAVAENERIRTLNALAQEFSVTLYTRSDTSRLHNINCRGGVSTLTQMPKVFAASRINLNMTMKPIQTGLSLRVWDILGCGGFLLSNYQAEIPEYFEIGKDLDCYESLDELKEKCAYYLTHDDIRAEIADHGYRKVKQMHTYRHRFAMMMELLTKTPPAF